MATHRLARETNDNPLDVVEHLATGNNWPFERAGEDEIALVVTGRWTDYQISFTWMSEIEALHLACAFDMKVPELRLAEVQQLVALINEQLWIGHFDVWMQNGMVMFRHALVLAGGVAASGRQCEAVLASALDACERYYPAFQFVVWAGKSAREAMDSAMFETVRRGVSAQRFRPARPQAPATRSFVRHAGVAPDAPFLARSSWRPNGNVDGSAMTGVRSLLRCRHRRGRLP